MFTSWRYCSLIDSEKLVRWRPCVLTEASLRHSKAHTMLYIKCKTFKTQCYKWSKFGSRSQIPLNNYNTNLLQLERYFEFSFMLFSFLELAFSRFSDSSDSIRTILIPVDLIHLLLGSLYVKLPLFNLHALCLVNDIMVNFLVVTLKKSHVYFECLSCLLQN